MVQGCSARARVPACDSAATTPPTVCQGWSSHKRRWDSTTATAPGGTRARVASATWRHANTPVAAWRDSNATSACTTSMQANEPAAALADRCDTHATPSGPTCQPTARHSAQVDSVPGPAGVTPVGRPPPRRGADDAAQARHRGTCCSSTEATGESVRPASAMSTCTVPSHRAWTARRNVAIRGRHAGPPPGQSSPSRWQSAVQLAAQVMAPVGKEKGIPGRGAWVARLPAPPAPLPLVRAATNSVAATGAHSPESSLDSGGALSSQVPPLARSSSTAIVQAVTSCSLRAWGVRRGGVGGGGKNTGRRNAHDGPCNRWVIGIRCCRRRGWDHGGSHQTTGMSQHQEQ
jgi:hypothetical protein